MGKPVWGVGPLLPEQNWRSADALIFDEKVRSKRESNVREDEVKDWLDSKSCGSVIYVSFGTLVSPAEEELAELANALEELNRPFIWVVKSHRVGPHPAPGTHGDGDFFLDSFADRTKGRGLVISGWAPQLLILSHPSTAIIISHCGWNSTLEAIGRGIPMLAWPIRGDQPRNAKLLMSHLKVGLSIRAKEDGHTEPVKKAHILQGIKKLMADNEIRNRAKSLQCIFDRGFPESSVASLDALSDLIRKQKFTSSTKEKIGGDVSSEKQSDK
ncbi:hypothetical protein GIB67_013181 [Kingdonia uniflora]|uniref:Uncharacterized protein n=1 Tax=Kingdonia uniflora TaxID=39325 RepID=A0A7J7LCZ2_9MAGN|nr:hypothetical protein GIB67_013181 [Kingdonia uniflora]